MAIEIEIVDPEGRRPIATRRDLYRAAFWVAVVVVNNPVIHGAPDWLAVASILACVVGCITLAWRSR